MEMLFNIAVFVLFLMLWIAFAYALVANQGGLDALWQWSRSLHPIIQAGIWLLTLPLAISLWVWETGWPLVARVLLIAGIGVWNLWLFYPWKS